MGQRQSGTRERVAFQHQLRTSLYTHLVSDLVKMKLEIIEEGEVRCTALSPNNQFILTANGRILKVYEHESGAEVMRFKHRSNINHCCFSPCGSYILAASSNKNVKLWDLQEGIALSTWKTKKVVDKCGFSPNGKYCWTSSWTPIVTIWDPHKGTKVKSFKANGTIRCCAFLKDNITILTGGDAGEVRIFQLAEHPIRWNRNCNFDIDGIALSRDQKYMIFYGDHDACLMDRQEFNIPWKVTSVRSIAFSHREDIVITCNRRSMSFWAPFAASELGNLDAHKHLITSLNMTENRSHLLTMDFFSKSNISTRSTVKLWHNETALIDKMEMQIMEKDIDVIEQFTTYLGDAKGWIVFLRVALDLDLPSSLNFATRVFNRNYENLLESVARFIESEEFREDGEELLKLTLQVLCRNPTITPETMHLLVRARTLVKKVTSPLQIHTLVNEAAGMMLEKLGPFVADYDIVRFVVSDIIEPGPGFDTFIQQYVVMLIRFIERSGEIDDDVDELRDLARELTTGLIGLIQRHSSSGKSHKKNVRGLYSSHRRRNSLKRTTSLAEQTIPPHTIDPLQPEGPIINSIHKTFDYHIEMSQWIAISTIIKTLADCDLLSNQFRRKLRQKAHNLLSNLNAEGTATYERFLALPTSNLLLNVKDVSPSYPLTQEKFHKKLPWYHGDDEAVDLVKFNRCIRPLNGRLPLEEIKRSFSPIRVRGALGRIGGQMPKASFVDGSGHQYYTQFLRLNAGMLKSMFEDKLQTLFPKSAVFPHLNSLQECFDLTRQRCKHKQQPKAAHLMDLMSTLLVFETPKEVLDAKNIITENFEVLAITNTFRKDCDITQVFFGFRMLRISILLQKDDVFHVAEICLTLQEFLDLNTAATRFRSVRDLDFASEGSKISRRNFYRSMSFSGSDTDLLQAMATYRSKNSQKTDEKVERFEIEKERDNSPPSQMSQGPGGNEL